MARNNRITGYIWYNPDLDTYQKGTRADYDFFREKSSNQSKFSLILKLTSSTSDLVAFKLTKELNTARQRVLLTSLRTAV